MKNEEWRIAPRISTQQAQLFHFSTPRHSVKNGTLIGILAAHTAENDLRTFSVVFLKGKPPKNHDFCSLRKHRFFRIFLQANSISCTTRRDLAHPREKKRWKHENAQRKNKENFAHYLNYLSRNPDGWPPRLLRWPPLRAEAAHKLRLCAISKISDRSRKLKVRSKKFQVALKFSKKILKSHDFVENTEQTRTSESAVDAQASNLRRV